MKTLLMALLLVAAPAAWCADAPDPQIPETWIDVSVTSIHLSSEKFNQKNFGLGLERKWGDVFVMAGRYRNSIDRPSRYALLGYTPFHAIGADIGAVAGALDGYAMNDGKPFFAVGGIIRWSGEKYRTELLLLPPIKEKITHDADGGTWTRHATPAAIGLMFGTKW